MALKRGSALLTSNDPAYVKYLCELDTGMHGFNSARCGSREAADYVVSQFDRAAQMALKTLSDRASALQFGRTMDWLVRKSLEFWQRWRREALPALEQPSPETLAETREGLLRRAEHRKAEAHSMVAAQIEKTPEQRGARRRRVLNPLLEKARITSDGIWAERAGATVDRNTPRDYRTGKTKRLQRATRQALAEPLGIWESELPE